MNPVSGRNAPPEGGILVVRRDNIGDLVCTTPLIAALRRHHPQTWIGALVNTYNAPVLEGNPDLDAVLAYTKLKHLGHGASPAGALVGRLRMLWQLRRRCLDCVLLAADAPQPRMIRLARLLAPRRIVHADTPALPDTRHEVEAVYALGQPLGVTEPIPSPRVVAAPEAVAAARAAANGAGPLIALQISARRARQRWPAARFAELALRLHRDHHATPMLLWSPGASDDARHPGDDDKARQIEQAVGGRARLVLYRTPELRALIGALAASDLVITPDGGAMHLAAGLGKPVIALFGDSPVSRWRPWGVAHRVLQAPGADVNELGVDDVIAALRSLREAR